MQSQSFKDKLKCLREPLLNVASGKNSPPKRKDTPW